MTMDQIIETLDTINRHYGCGEITNTVTTLDGCGYVTRKKQYGTDERKFRLIDGYIVFLGKKRKVGYTPRFYK